MMTSEFGYCPTCAGTTEDDAGNYEGCPACAGSGLRPLTEENARLAITAREWMDDRIGDFWSDWIRVNNSYRGWGVEGWDISGGQLVLRIDMSRRGCHDSETMRFPAEWFYVTGAARTAFLDADLEERARGDAQAREQHRINEIERLKAQLARLQSGQTG